MTEDEIHGSIKILKGPPEPAVLPEKGVGIFREDKRLQFYVLSKFNNSDTTVRTPVTLGNAFKLFWNLL